MKATIENGVLLRDGLKLTCPRQSRPEGYVYCAVDCPAFYHIPKTGNIAARVELRCFPQVVEFEIEE